MTVSWTTFKHFATKGEVTKIDFYLNAIEFAVKDTTVEDTTVKDTTVEDTTVEDTPVEEATYVVEISNASIFELKFYDMCKECEKLETIPTRYLQRHYVKREHTQAPRQASAYHRLKQLIPLGFVIICFSIYKFRNMYMNTPNTPRNTKMSTEFETLDEIAGMTSKREITDVLNNLQKIKELGGTLPKGFLLQGPPGVGKTMIARILAKQTNNYFYQINASEFSQPLVGAGCQKISDIVTLANKNSPAIIFID